MCSVVLRGPLFKQVAVVLQAVLSLYSLRTLYTTALYSTALYIVQCCTVQYSTAVYTIQCKKTVSRHHTIRLAKSRYTTTLFDPQGANTRLGSGLHVELVEASGRVVAPLEDCLAALPQHDLGSREDDQISYRFRVFRDWKS